MNKFKSWMGQPISKGGLLKAYGVCAVASLAYTAVTMRKVNKMFNYEEEPTQEEKHDEAEKDL